MVQIELQLKNYIFLSPHFPPNWVNFCEKLNNKGFKVLGIGEDQYDRLSEKLKTSLTEYFKVNSMDNEDEMIRAVGFYTHKYGRIDYIESHNEHWLELEAKLRLNFNVDGYKPADIQYIKKKSEMKKIFQEVGVPVARGLLFKNKEQLLDFISQVGFPIIAKPNIGVGAFDTYKINSNEEINNFINSKPEVEYFVEEFVNGRIVSYDGLVNADGEVVFSASLEYTKNVMEIVHADEEIQYWIHNERDHDLEEIALKSIKAFKPKARFFHFEFFKTENNAIIALEANLRPPGGYTLDMWNWANDMDIYNEYANVLLNNKFSRKFQPPSIVFFCARKNKYTHTNSHKNIMTKYEGKLVLYTEMPQAFQQVMGDHAYIYRVDTYNEMWEIISFIADKRSSTK